MELIIFVGLQGAGKSSFYRHMFSQSHVLVSKDLMKNRKHKSVYQDKLIRKLLGEGHSIVVDNMNLERGERAALIHTGQELGARVMVYYFPLSIGESFERNEGPNRNKVPPVAIYTANNKLQIPTKAEGMDELFHVHMEAPSIFKISYFPDLLNPVVEV